MEIQRGACTGRLPTVLLTTQSQVSLLDVFEQRYLPRPVHAPLQSPDSGPSHLFRTPVYLINQTLVRNGLLRSQLLVASCVLWNNPRFMRSGKETQAFMEVGAVKRRIVRSYT